MGHQQQEEKVVVFVKPEVYAHRTDNTYVMRFDELSLTAYGSSINETREVLFSMFRILIDELRSRGILGKRLKQLKVRWQYASDFRGDWSEVRDMSDSPTPVAVDTVKALGDIDLLAESSNYQAVSKELAAAA